MGMGMHLTLPVFMKLTRAFAVAVLAVTLGIVFESLSEKGFDFISQEERREHSITQAF